MTDPLPDGEEIWLRRDTHDRAGLLVKRELAVVFHSLSILVLRPLVIYVMFFFIRRALHSAWGTSYPLITLAIALGVPLLLVLPTLRLAYPLWLLSITRSRFCPTWLYAEQLNPERLTIYHLRKPPTMIQLKGAQITKHKVGSSTTINIADKQGDNAAILITLLPNEYDRFMQYWNAANA